MIDWIHAMALSWGHQLRRHARAEGDLPSLAGKLMELGPQGAAIRGSGAQHFGEGLLGDALEFHCAWKKLDRFADRRILHLHYVEPGPVKRKVIALKCPTSTYWQRLHYAHRRMASILQYGQCAYGQNETVRAISRA